MNEEELKSAITELLTSLHAYNKLNLLIVNIISSSFKVDAVELCRENGITYNIK